MSRTTILCATNHLDDTPEPLGVVDALAQLSFVVSERLAAHAAAHGLSPVQTRLLGVLRDRRPTMGELASLLGLDKSSTTGLVDRAQRRDLVDREPAPDDGRSVIVALTPHGAALSAEVAAAFAADVADLLAPVPARDRDRLRRILTDVLVADAAGRDVDLFDTLD